MSCMFLNNKHTRRMHVQHSKAIKYLIPIRQLWFAGRKIISCITSTCISVLNVTVLSFLTFILVLNLFLPSSLYLIVTSSLLVSWPLNTLCIIRTNSSYVMSSLWMGIRRMSSPSWTLMISFPDRSIWLLLILCNSSNLKIKEHTVLQTIQESIHYNTQKGK